MWNDDKKMAAVYYCYLSLEDTSGEKKSNRLSALFDTGKNIDWYLSVTGLKTPEEKVPEDDDALQEYVASKLKNLQHIENCTIAFSGFGEVKDEIVKYCDEVIDGFSDDERYDCIVEEIDRLCADSNSGILSFDARKYLWVFVLYSVAENILTDTRRKYLKHFCRIANLDKSLLPEMEEAAKTLTAIGKKRLEAKTSGDSYANVIALLAAYDSEETAAYETVNKLLGIEPISENDEEDDDERFGVIDDISEAICDGIMTVSDGVSDFINDLALKIHP
jgi:hypothetical protein